MEKAAEANRKLAASEMNAGKTVVKSKPASIEVGSTSVCNMNPPCVMCGKWTGSDPSGRRGMHLGKDIVELIAPDLDKALVISLHGTGEPLANPHLFDIVKAAPPEAEIRFNTNGLLLDDRKADAVIAAKVKRIGFSLDAATPEVYKKIRGQDFGKVVGNIRRLKEKKDAAGARFPDMVLNMVLMRENLGEIPKFFELAKGLGAGVYMNHMNEGNDYRLDVNGWTFDYEAQQCSHDPEYHDRMVEEAFRLSAAYKVPFEFVGKRGLAPAKTEDTRPMAAAPAVKKEFFCPRPWQTMVVNEYGAVSVCCHQTEPVGYLRPGLKPGAGGLFRELPYMLLKKAYYIVKGRPPWSAAMRVGIMDIWNSGEMKRLREKMLAHEVPDICKSPNRCIYRDRY